MPTQAELQALWETATPAPPAPPAPTTVQPGAQLSQDELAQLWETGTPAQVSTELAAMEPVLPPQAPMLPGGLPADVPTEEALAMPPAVAPAPAPGFGAQALGIGETALATITGATGGAAGSVLGFIDGLYEAMQKGILGTEEGSQLIEQRAAEQAEKLTRTPRTEVGQQMTAQLGEALAPLQALGPVQIPRGTPIPLRRRREAGAAPEAKAPEAPPIAPEAPLPSVKPPLLTAEELAGQARKAGEGGLGAKKAEKILGEQATPDPQVIESARRLGIEEHLQPDHVTTNQQYRELAQAVKSFPGSEARQQELQGLAAVAKRADDLITEMGGTEDWSTMSQNVKNRMRTVQGDLEKKANTLYGELADTIPARAGVNTDNIVSWIRNQAEEFGGEKFLSPTERKILKRLQPKEGELPTYALLDKTRKELTAARVKKEGVFKDADTGLIKKLENEMMKDQQAVAEAYGVQEVFNDARQSVAIRKSLEQDMTALFGRELDKNFVSNLQTGIKKLSAGDVSNFKRVIEAIPEEMRPEVVATSLDTAFGKNARNGSLNFNSFANWYENATKNREAFNTFAKYLPAESKRSLEDLYRVSKGITQATRERITTGRLRTVQEALQGQDSLIGNLYSLAKRSAAGIAAEAVTTPVGLPGAGMSAAIASALTKGRTAGSKAADKVISSPEFIQFAKDGDATKLARSAPFKRYMKATGNVVTSPELWILEAMRPPIEDESN